MKGTATSRVTRGKSIGVDRGAWAVVTHSSQLGILAASAALRALGDRCSSVEFASTRTLAETLQRIGKDGPDGILVLGHRLRHRVREISSAVDHLTERGVVVLWLGCSEYEDPAWEELKGTAEVRIPKRTKTLTHAVAALFGIRGDEWMGFLQKASLDRSDREPEEARNARDLAEAMVDRYWQYDDRDAAPNTAKALAIGPPLDPEMLRAIQVHRLYGPTHLTGKSEAIRAVRAQIKVWAKDPLARVLIIGETGTGKELAARLIHMGSTRALEPFQAVNCATLRGDLLRSELFGHEKGSFTGAESRRQGLFEAANHGTLFLDEIGELDHSAQSMLLRVLQEGRLRRLGSTQDIEVDVRVLAATHRDLMEEVHRGTFREDLYYRLAQVSFRIPPLRERPDDIPFIAIELLHILWEQRHPVPRPPVPALPPKSREALKNYSWPGNARELENILLRALLAKRLDDLGGIIEEASRQSQEARQRVSVPVIALATPPGITPAAKPEPAPAAGKEFSIGETTLDDVTRRYLQWLLDRHGTKTAVQRIAEVSQGLVNRRLGGPEKKEK